LKDEEGLKIFFLLNQSTATWPINNTPGSHKNRSAIFDFNVPIKFGDQQKEISNWPLFNPIAFIHFNTQNRLITINLDKSLLLNLLKSA